MKLRFEQNHIYDEHRQVEKVHIMKIELRN